MSRLIVLAAICIALAGCATAPSPSTAPVAANPEVGHAEPFAKLLQTGVSYDYEPTDSPADATRQADLVVVGTVKDVVPGRTLPYGRANSQANLVVAVQEVVKGNTDDTVYVEVTKPVGVAIEELLTTSPTGRVVLFLDDRTDVEASGPEAGRPTGSRIYTPLIDGFIVESGTGWLSGLVPRDDLRAGWSSLSTVDDIVEASAAGG